MDKLHILWTTPDKEVVLNMLAMYAFNSIKMGWWNQVNIIIWGPSANLVANDTQIQTEIAELRNAGITIEACKDCAQNYKVENKLEKLGIKVHYMGEHLTGYIKSGEKLISI
ncbi:MAG: DsrE family protein [Bacteroidales bacterium]|nr:DsrE family protein [Bacteroidales bacterium]